MSRPTILAIDTATDSCSVALHAAGAVASARFEEMARGQSEALFPMIAGVLAEAATDYADLDAVAVTRGPGAFTGLRIGLSAARAIALARGIPCFGATTLAVVAERAMAGAPGRPVVAAIDSRREAPFVQVFSADGGELSEPRAAVAEAIPEILAAAGVAAGEVIVAGTAGEPVAAALAGSAWPARLAAGPALPDARWLAALVFRGYAERSATSRQAFPEPLYLRAPEATVPKHGGRLRPG